MYIFLIAVLLLLPVSLYWIYKSTFKTKNPFSSKASLYYMLKKNGLSISDIAVLSNMTIGIDHKINKIIWLAHGNHAIRENSLSVREIQLCKIIKETDPLTGCTTKVVMEITFHTGKEPVYISFFDESIDPVYKLPSRIRKAGYWKSKIQLQLNSIKAGLMLEYVL